LSEVQHARVPQLPIIPRERVDGHAEKTVIMAVDPELTGLIERSFAIGLTLRQTERGANCASVKYGDILQTSLGNP
jgi:hypothetical protein